MAAGLFDKMAGKSKSNSVWSGAQFMPKPGSTAVAHGQLRWSTFPLQISNCRARATAVSSFKLVIEFDSRHSLHVIAPSQLTFGVPSHSKIQITRMAWAGYVSSMIMNTRPTDLPLSGKLFGPRMQGSAVWLPR
jgi:hypothetical protein